MSILKAILLTVLVSLIELGILLAAYLAFDTKNTPEIQDHVHGIGVIVARLVAYTTVFVFFWKKDFIKEDFGFSEIKIAVIPLLVLLVIATEFVFRPFSDFEKILLKFQGQEILPYNYTFGGFTAHQIYFTISALFVAPILEELFFRKFLFAELLKKYGLPLALGISSLLFSIIHWETLNNLFPAFLFGIISGYIFFKTKKIAYSIILHFFANLASIVLAVKGADYYEWLHWLNFGYLYWALFVLGIISCFGIIKYILLITNRSETE